MKHDILSLSWSQEYINIFGADSDIHTHYYSMPKTFWFFFSKSVLRELMESEDETNPNPSSVPSSDYNNPNTPGAIDPLQVNYPTGWEYIHRM